MTKYVLDSFAVLSILYGEAGSADVLSILRGIEHQKANVAMNVANLGEVYYSVAREEGEADAIRAVAYVKQAGIELVTLDERLALAAGRLKANFRMSYADCIAAATAREREAIIVTGDPEFRAVEKEVAVRWISAEK